MKENFAAKVEVYQPKIKIIGVGNCGMNAVNTVVEKHIGNVDLFVIHFDEKVLKSSMLDEQQKIQIGEKITNGQEANKKSNVGKKAEEISIDKIEEIVKDTDILFVVNGVSGGTEVTVSFITELAKKQGAINIVFAVTPTNVEGKRKNMYAEKALHEFMNEESCIDAVINVSNERFIKLVDRKATLENVFNRANEEISRCIKALVDIFREEKGLISLKFKDFKKFMTNVGFTGIGISQKHKFEEQEAAIKEIMEYPLIRGSFESAEKVIISIQGGSNLTLNFVHEIAKEITNKIDENAEVMLSVQIVKTFSSDEFKIMVITA